MSAEQTIEPPMSGAPGHGLFVTGGGPFGRAWVDCSCGYTLVCASKKSATCQALVHLHQVAGCVCPPHVVALDVHPAVTPPAP